ncbi:MAG: LytTR family DNA-binding domain-containing protein [Bacteroidota bacterium]
MNPVRTVIADDEPPARALVREYLAGVPEVEIVAEATSGTEAVEVLRRERPDLVFLDVQMPGATGFEVLEQLAAAGDPLPAVVFSTAYDQYALGAFEVSAVDYLLKPYSAERLRAALDRALDRLRAAAPSDDLERIAQLLTHDAARSPFADRLFLRVGTRIVPVRTADLEWVEAAGDYTTLHAAGETYTAGLTLSALAEQLDPARFVRVHRSTVIAVDALRHLESDGSGGYVATLDGGARVRVSRSYAGAIRDRIA